VLGAGRGSRYRHAMELRSPPPSDAGAAPAGPAGWAAFVAALSARSAVIVVVLAVVTAVLLNPFFSTPYPVLQGRTLFISAMLLFAYTAAGLWHPRWLPKGLAQVMAVVLTAPLATLVAYTATLGRRIGELMSLEMYLWGIAQITVVGMVLGLVVALGALYREREAQLRSQALQFALERETLQCQALDARLSLLQAQIEPHFLFNTLANVQALVESGSPRAPALLQSLIGYLRAAVPRLHNSHATLGDEEALLRAYLELMQMRMPDRLQWQLRIDPALRELRFPPMALLTLVENAVRHGIDPSEAGGRIEVEAGADAASGRIRIVVSDTGVGMAETAPPGMGLTNLQARLEAFFGSGATLALCEAAPHGVQAELQFRALAKSEDADRPDRR
jgi:signal transduction histidine kinase